MNTKDSKTVKMINPLTATDVYIRQIRLFPQRIQNMSFIFIVVLRTWKSLTPKNVTAVKGLVPFLF
jgi:hypothetical protein